MKICLEDANDLIKPLHNNLLAMLYHLASHLSTLGRRENEESECEESENEVS